MSQVTTEQPDSGFLNGEPPAHPFEGMPRTTEAMAPLLAGKAPEPPSIGAVETDVTLPAGLLMPDGRVFRQARVRELNGFAEERLSRLDVNKNAAAFVTELLVLGVESIGTEDATKDMLRHLLIGDRDQLLIGVRKATYGPEMKFVINCTNCGEQSDIGIDLNEDLEVSELEDPLVRTFEVPLRRGVALVKLLDGADQEAYSENFARKTQAEIDTVMIAKSLLEIDHVALFGDEMMVRALPAVDRATLVDFIAAHQPGPKTNEIRVNCATCAQEYPILIGLGNLFRF